MCETKLLSLKKEVYEIESCQREMMGLRKHGFEYSSFRDVLEYRSHFEKQLGYQNGHFSQEILTHEYIFSKFRMKENFLNLVKGI